MVTDSLEALRRLIDAITLERRQAAPESSERPLVVTVSTGAGAGGRSVAQRLAERLDVPLFDKEILNAVAKEAHVDRAVLERLDERVDGLRGAWLRSLLTGENLFKEPYRRNLINAILGIACSSGVILGRGANFVLAHRPVLRARIVGTPDACAERLADEEGIDVEAARRKVTETDKERSEFIRTLYDRDINDPTAYDLVINSDRIALEKIAEHILTAMMDVEVEGEPPPKNQA